MTSVSLVLMAINSSVNFFIYCFANSAFRDECHDRISKISKVLFKNSIGHHDTSETSTMMPMQEVSCILNLKRTGGYVIHPLLWRSAAISQEMIQMFSNFLTFSKMMLGPE